jgi:hypothetical protein
MQHTKIVGVEEPAVVVEGDLLDGPEDSYAGIVDPGIEAAKLLDSRLGDPLHVLNAPDIGCDSDSFGAFGYTVTGEILQGGFVPRDENEFGPAISQDAGSRQADATQCSGENHHLLCDGLETHCHEAS